MRKDAMPIEPTKKIYEAPLIRREENAIQPRRKKPKKSPEKEGQRKVDIKV